jgi:hypothetical protein
MTPDQETTLLTSVARIDERTHAIKESVSRHETALSDVTVKTNANATSIARLKGIGAGIGGVFTLILAGLGLDRFSG